MEEFEGEGVPKFEQEICWALVVVVVRRRVKRERCDVSVLRDGYAGGGGDLPMLGVWGCTLREERRERERGRGITERPKFLIRIIA